MGLPEALLEPLLGMEGGLMFKYGSIFELSLTTSGLMMPHVIRCDMLFSSSVHLRSNIPGSLMRNKETSTIISNNFYASKTTLAISAAMENFKYLTIL